MAAEWGNSLCHKCVHHGTKSCLFGEKARAENCLGFELDTTVKKVIDEKGRVRWVPKTLSEMWEERLAQEAA